MRGIISNNGSSLALLEYQGSSSLYVVGERIGNYALCELLPNSVRLKDSAASIPLTLEPLP